MDHNTDLPVEKRIADLLDKMTLKEKIAQLDMIRGVEYATKPSAIHHCAVDGDSDFDYKRLLEDFGEDGTGFVHDVYAVPKTLNKLQKFFIENTRLGIPCIFTAEALHGVSGTRGTVFPVPLNFAATFDTGLIKEVGRAIGTETRALGMQEILAPNLDLAREPRWGRTEETLGEDTYLASRMAVALISGEQKDGNVGDTDAVVAEPKHYCVHGIPEGGTNCSPARAGKREIHSCHLPVFEAGIKEGGAYNVMASYNSIDGDVVMCSRYYLTDVLKNQLKTKGYARSDWGGIGRIAKNHHLVSNSKDALKLAISGGLDVQGCDLPNGFFRRALFELVEEGKVEQKRIDDAVSRVLRVKFDLGLFENPYTDEDLYPSVIRCENHKRIARQVAEESIVMLKNDHVLPLSKNVKSIALIGPSSNAQKIGGYSSVPTGYSVRSVYDEMKSLLGSGVQILQCDGCAITPGEKVERIVEGQPHLYSEGEQGITDAIGEAVTVAGHSEVIIVVAGDNTVTSGEGRDRCELTLSGRQRKLITALGELHKPMILVLENGKAVDLSKEKDLCAAILVAWFGGEFGARAIVDTIFGNNNPSGRLPVSFPYKSTRIPCYYSMMPGGDEEYYEGPKPALYPFGFGLSYTTFSYTNINIKKESAMHYSVCADITNTGNLAGDEVVQLYIDDIQSSVVTPKLLLKGFKRISLQPRESKTVCFHLDFDSLKLMDIEYTWTVESGDFRILLGASSDDIRCEGMLAIEEEEAIQANRHYSTKIPI